MILILYVILRTILPTHRNSISGRLLLLSLPLFMSDATAAETQQAASPMPPVVVAPVEVEEPKKENPCDQILISHDMDQRFREIQTKLEKDYNNGMPKQLRTDLSRLREDIDGLTPKLFDIQKADPQEVNHIFQLAIDYLDKMTHLMAKVNQVAPQVRDKYLIPYTNLTSIKAEHKACLMEAAVAEAKAEIDKEDIRLEDHGDSMNVYSKLTDELKRLNDDLYILQTSSAKQYVNLRADLMNALEKYNQDPSQGFSHTQALPRILNGVHLEIENLLPGLELSEKYYSIVD